MSEPRDIVDLVIRDETLEHERRTIMTPPQIAELTRGGFNIALVRWPERCFSDSEYITAVENSGNPQNFHLLDHDEWKTLPECANSIILGVKEIPRVPPGTTDFHLTHTYIHFDHSYKGQFGAAERLSRFAFGKLFNEDEPQQSILLDHEYSTDEDGKRTHAFGKSAGYATAAMSVLTWAQQVNGTEKKLEQHAYSRKVDFFERYAEEISNAIHKNGAPPEALILGSVRGRSANGVMKLLHDLNEYLPPERNIKFDIWDRAESSARMTEDSGLAGIEKFDLVLNCTYTETPCPPFANDATLQRRGEQLQIYGDVTCDTTPDKNRLRFSKYQTSDFDAPAIEVGDNVFAITVDHSPSLFPKEATLDIARQAFPHIKNLLHYRRIQMDVPLDSPWARATEAFEDNMLMPIHAYSLGTALVDDDDVYLTSMSPEERQEYLNDVTDEIERNIKLCLGELHELKPKEQNAFLYHFAMGMLRAHGFVDMAHVNTDEHLDTQRGNITDDIEALEAELSERFDMGTLVSAPEVLKLQELSLKLHTAFAYEDVLNGLELPPIEQAAEYMIDEKMPEKFHMFLQYVASAKELCAQGLYDEDQRMGILEQYNRAKMTLQEQAHLPVWFFESMEDTIFGNFTGKHSHEIPAHNEFDI